MQNHTKYSQYLGQGKVNTRALYCRKKPQLAYAPHGRFRRGEEIPLYECTVEGWYETRWQGEVGYVMALFIDPVEKEKKLLEEPKTDEKNLWYYGQISSNTLNVRQSPRGAILGLHPKKRYCLIRESAHPAYYESLWKGNPAYLAKEHVQKLEPASEHYIRRLSRMAFAEMGQSEPKAYSYYEASIGSKWCQSFVNWLALHAGAHPANVPKTASTPRAIVYHVLEGAGFRFVNARHKAKMRRFSSLLASQIEPTLGEEEQAYIPNMGDFVYFRWEKQPQDHCSHVGMVVNVDARKRTIQVLEGNVQNRVILRTWSWEDGQIVGYGVVR